MKRPDLPPLPDEFVGLSDFAKDALRTWATAYAEECVTVATLNLKVRLMNQLTDHATIANQPEVKL